MTTYLLGISLSYFKILAGVGESPSAIIHGLAEEDHVHEVEEHDHNLDYNGTGEIVEDCKKVQAVDIAILVDGSWSVGPENFNTMKAFLSSLANAFSIGENGVQLALAQYSDDPRSTNKQKYILT